MRLIALIASIVVCGLSACHPTVELPIKRATVPACDSNSGIVETVRYLAAQNDVEFYYGIHDDPESRFVVFRLVGQGFEISINMFYQDVLEVRIYTKSTDTAVRKRALATFDKIVAAMITDPSLTCPKAGGTQPVQATGQPQPWLSGVSVPSALGR